MPQLTSTPAQIVADTIVRTVELGVRITDAALVSDTAVVFADLILGGPGRCPWVTSHVFRKTCATILDDAGLSARTVADQLGHARPSMTQDVYMGRAVVSRDGAHALDRAWAQPTRGAPKNQSGG